MKSKHIVNHLRSWLPNFTPYFTDEADIVSMIRAGSTIIVTTATDHKLAVGDYVTIFGALNPVDISSLTAEKNRPLVRYGLQNNPGMKGQNMIDLGDKVATVVTSEDHDLTEGYVDYQKISIIGGDDATYNGEHYLLQVPDRRTFSYLLDSASPLPPSPDPGASKKLLEDLNYGFKGFHKVASVDDPKTFTYTTIFATKLGLEAEGAITARIVPRITNSVSIDRAIEAFTPQLADKFYIFVVLNDTSANKDRAIPTDATSSQGLGEDIRSLIITPFSVFVLAPAKTEIAAANVRDKMQDLLAPICRSLVSYRFPADFVTKQYSGTTFTAHGFYAYTGATYIHEFRFETKQYLVLDDAFNEEINVAFRDIDMTYQSYLNEGIGDTISGIFSLDDKVIE